MNTYRVVIGTSANIVADVKIVRAKNVGEAEKKAIKAMGEGQPEGIHAVKIEQLDGEFVE
jgi:hypothetical protein